MLTPRTIDLTKLKSNKLNESYVAEFAAEIKYLLRHLVDSGTSSDIKAAIANLSKLREEEESEPEEEDSKPKIAIRGEEKDVKKFAQTLAKEKDYAENYIEHGLGSEELTDSKIELEKAIHEFEKTTRLKWPLK